MRIPELYELTPIGVILVLFFMVFLIAWTLTYVYFYTAHYLYYIKYFHLKTIRKMKNWTRTRAKLPENEKFVGAGAPANSTNSDRKNEVRTLLNLPKNDKKPKS
jgi:hypothetical protein